MAEAFDIVCRDDDRARWLEERKKYVTGSVAAQLLGTHRYGSLLGTYLRMRGVNEEEETRAANDVLDWGTDQQVAVVANMKRRGFDVVDDRALIRSREWPFLAVTRDGLVRVVPREKPFEIKTTRSRDAANEWSEGVPEHVKPQVQLQIAVSGVDQALVAAVVFGAPPVYTWVPRDDKMIADIVERGREFMRRVELGDPPPPDGGEDCDEAVAALVGDKRIEDQIVELGIDLVKATDRIDECDTQIKTLEREKRRLTQSLRIAIGDAHRGRLTGRKDGWLRVDVKGWETLRIKGVPLAKRDEVERALRAGGFNFELVDEPHLPYSYLKRSKK